jgi:hypothetical protein
LDCGWLDWFEFGWFEFGWFGLGWIWLVLVGLGWVEFGWFVLTRNFVAILSLRLTDSRKLIYRSIVWTYIIITVCLHNPLTICMT